MKDGSDKHGAKGPMVAEGDPQNPGEEFCSALRGLRLLLLFF